MGFHLRIVTIYLGIEVNIVPIVQSSMQSNLWRVCEPVANEGTLGITIKTLHVMKSVFLTIIIIYYNF